MITQQLIRDLVVRYLKHPRQYNAGVERTLFLVLNWFIRAVQVYERSNLTDIILRRIDEADNEGTRQELAALLQEIYALEYIIEGADMEPDAFKEL